ncbi:Chromo domain-like protein [Apiospora marii]|uniref:Chromo domain-like protein n=1 Tax=Apiospora marii TaxID=335849 RepID=A0ABR1RKG6_9PEZI
MSHLPIPSVPLPKPSETPHGEKLSGDGAHIASSRRANLVPTSTMGFPMKAKESSSSGKGAHSQDPISLIEDDEFRNPTPIPPWRSGNNYQAEVSASSRQNPTLSLPPALFASGQPVARPQGPESVSFISTPPTKLGHPIVSEVRPRGAESRSLSAVKTPTAVRSSFYGIPREDFGNLPWMKAAAQRRKARKASVQSIPCLSQNKYSQPLDGLTIATSGAQLINRGTPSSFRIPDGSTIGPASKTQPDSASNTDSRGSVVAGPKRKAREELSKSDGSLPAPRCDASDDHASSRDQTATAEEQPVRKRQRRTDQPRPPSSPTSQPPHRDGPVGRSVETLPVSNPESSNIVSNLSAASFEEIPLFDGILKRVIANGQQTYQLQFTADKTQDTAYCPQHISNPEAPVRQHGRTKKPQKPHHSSDKTNETESVVIGEVDHLIARWGSGRRAVFLLKWTDSTRDWVPRGDIDEEWSVNSRPAMMASMKA